MTTRVLAKPAVSSGVCRRALLLGRADAAVAERLSGAALSVTVVDPSDDACEEAAERLVDQPWVEFVPADPFAWEPPPGVTYDRVVVAEPRGASLLRPRRQSALAARAAAWLSPGGRLSL